MSRKHRGQSRRNRRKGIKSPFVYLPVLAIITIAVSVFAIYSTNNPGLKSRAATESPGDSVERNTSALSGHRVMSAFSDYLLVRASGGSCTVPGTIEISGDQGKTWVTSDITSDLNVAQILDVAAIRPGFVQAVAYDSRTCEDKAIQSGSSGGSWEMSKLSSATYFDINSPEEYVLDGEDFSLPCAARAVSNSDTTVAVACQDSTVAWSDDLDTWSDPISVNNLSTLAYSRDGEELYIVTAKETGCAGVQVRTLIANKLSEPTTCYQPKSDFDPEAVAATTSPDALYIWIDREVARTSDAGATWAQF